MDGNFKHTYNKLKELYIKDKPHEIIDILNLSLKNKKYFENKIFLYISGLCNYKLKRYDQALRLFKNASFSGNLDSSSEFSKTICYNINHNIGSCYLELGKLDKARKCFENFENDFLFSKGTNNSNNSSKLSISSNEFGYVLGMLLDYDKASNKFQDSIDHDKSFANAYRNKLFVEFKKLWRDEIENDYRKTILKCIKPSLDIPQTFANISEDKFLENNIDDRVKAFVDNLGPIKSKLEDKIENIYDKMKSKYENYLTLFPNYHYLKNTYGYILSFLCKYSEALDICNKSNEYDPSIKGNYHGICYSLIRLKAHPNAYLDNSYQVENCIINKKISLNNIDQVMYEDILKIIDKPTTYTNDIFTWIYKGYVHFKIAVKVDCNLLKVNNKELEKSLLCFYKALELDDKNFIVLNNLGMVYIYLNNYEMAKKYFDQAQSIASTFPFVYFNNAFISVMEPKKDIQDFENDIKESINLLNRSLYYLTYNWFRDPLIQFTNIYAVIFFKSFCHGLLSDYTISLKYLEFAKTILDFIENNFRIGHNDLYKNYRIELERNLGYVYAKLSSNNSSYSAQAETHYNNFLDIATNNNIIEIVNINNPYILNSYGYFFLHFRNQTNDDVIYSNPTKNKAYTIEDFFNASISIINKQKTNFGNFALPFYNLGSLYYMKAMNNYSTKSNNYSDESKKYFEKAKIKFEEAIKIQKTLIDAWIGKTMSHLYLEEYVNALTSVNECLKIENSFDSMVISDTNKKYLPQILKCFILIHLNRFQEAYDLLNELEKDDKIALQKFSPELASWFFLTKGHALTGLKRFQESIVSYSQLLTLKIINSDNIWIYIGISFCMAGRFVESKNALKNISSNSDIYIRSLKHLFIGLCNIHRNQLDDALTEFHLVEDISDDDKIKSISAYNSGICYLRQNDPENAFKKIEDSAYFDKDFSEPKEAIEKIKFTANPDILQYWLIGKRKKLKKTKTEASDASNKRYYLGLIGKIKKLKKTKTEASDASDNGKLEKTKTEASDASNKRYYLGLILIGTLFTGIGLIFAFPIINQTLIVFDIPSIDWSTIVNIDVLFTVATVIILIILLSPWVKRLRTLGIELEIKTPTLNEMNLTVKLPSFVSTRNIKMPLTYSLMIFRVPIQQPIFSLISEIQGERLKGVNMPNRYAYIKSLLDDLPELPK